MVAVKCPCGFRMEAEVAHLGQEAQCPRCGALFRLWPADETSSAKPDAVWFVRAGTTEFGPFPPSELVRFVAEGRIQRDSLVRRGSSGPWTPAALVRGLLDAPAKRPAPPVAAHAVPAPSRAHGGGERRGRAARRGGAGAPRRDWAAQLAGQPVVLLALLLALGAAGAAIYFVNRAKPAAPAPVPVASGPTPASTPAPASPTPPPAVPAKPAPLTPQQLVTKAGPSVAVLQGRNGTGSGFLVGPGLLATNRHVIADELVEHVRVRWPDGGRTYEGAYGVALVYEDPTLDLALLEVDVKLPPLPLALDVLLARGQEIMCIGSPGIGGGQMLSNAIGRGLLGTPTVIEGQEYLQLDLAVNPGNSGGPVFNMDGKVVGVVTLKATQLSNVGFCLPAKSLAQCLDRSKALSTAERARVVAMHRLRVCAAALLRAAKVYAAAGDIYVEAMNTAKAAKVDINVGLRKAQAAVDDFMHQMNGRLMFDVREQAERAARDEALSTTCRDRYNELIGLHTELKGHVSSPSGTLESFTKELKRLEAALRSVEAHFVRNEGVRVDDE